MPFLISLMTKNKQQQSNTTMPVWRARVHQLRY